MFDLPIMSSVYLTIPVESEVRRTWLERLFTWPWRPWIETKVVSEQVPDPKLYQLPNGIVIGHPATVSMLKRELNK